MSYLVRWRSVRYIFRVKMRSRRHAPVRRITELVHVQPMFSRRQASDVAYNRSRTPRAWLRQGQYARDARRTFKNDDRFL